MGLVESVARELGLAGVLLVTGYPWMGLAILWLTRRLREEIKERRMLQDRLIEVTRDAIAADKEHVAAVNQLTATLTALRDTGR